MTRKSRKSKEAKFFCESCNSEVPRNSRVCPTCGKFFAAVRCPQCGRTGSNEDFKNGCPTCGYAINPDTMGRAPGFTPSFGSNINYKNSSSVNAVNLFRNHNGRKKKSYVESGLPAWVYLSTLLVLIVLMALLYSCLIKPF